MKKIPLMLALAAVLAMTAACSSTEPAQTSSSGSSSSQAESASTSAASASSEDSRAPADISEAAMDNFLARLSEGNYVMDAKNYLKTTVSSENQLCLDYVDESYSDFAVMSVNNEVFQAKLTEDGLGDAAFLGEGTALEAASDRLPTVWLSEEVSGGNIFNVFFNDTAAPLTFTSYDDNLKTSVAGFAGYGQNLVRLMHEVYLTLDAENPTTARITAEMDEDVVARIAPDDIDITITFGGAETNAAADAWMSSPVYPKARTAWNDTDEFIFNSVFITTDGASLLPFPAFASYALLNDTEDFVRKEQATLRDSHATEEDVNAYLAELEKAGFEKAEETDEDGAVHTWYRKLLREDYHCYASVCVEYNNGADIIAKKYYDMPAYDTLEAVNSVLPEHGYPALPDAIEGLNEIHALDHVDEATEGWLYFFDYDTVLYVDMTFDDDDAAVAFINEYREILENTGFTLETTPEEVPMEEEESSHMLGESIGEVHFHPLKDEVAENTDERYVSENGFADFRYLYGGDGKLTLRFKAQTYIYAKEAAAIISDAGFPAIELTEPTTVRNLAKFQKAQYDRDVTLCLSVSQNFADNAAAESFLDSYTAALEEAGFLSGAPGNVGSLKTYAWYNDVGMAVCFDYFPSDTNPQIYFDFIAP